MHSDQGLHCPLTELLSAKECMNGEQIPGFYFLHAHDDLNLCACSETIFGLRQPPNKNSARCNFSVANEASGNSLRSDKVKH